MAFTAWEHSLASIQADLKANHTSEDVSNAGRQVVTAARRLKTTLENLNKPNTASGQQAREQLNTLKTELAQTKATVEKTLHTHPTSSAEALARVSTISQELSKVAQDFTMFFGNLKKLDPKSELTQGFQQAPACSPYV
jgi:exonuclease VII large subunit